MHAVLQVFRRIRDDGKRVLRSITSKKSAAALALVGLAAAVVWPGLEAIGYELSAKQGYALLFLTVLLVIGVFIALAWPDSRSNSEPETLEQRRRRQALQEWHDKIEGWSSDKDNPLVKAQLDDLRRKRARRLTLEVARKQDREGKRDILLTLYDWNLIKRYPYPVVDLKHVDLSGAHLGGVNLQGASLRSVNLEHSDLSGAQLGKGLEDTSTVEQWARLAKMVAGDYTNSLESCDLREAKLGGAILKDAVLVACKFNGADFEGADFCRADLRGANLGEARNLSQEQVNKAYGSHEQEEMPDTQLPDNLNAPESWRRSIYEQKQKRGDL